MNHAAEYRHRLRRGRPVDTGLHKPDPRHPAPDPVLVALGSCAWTAASTALKNLHPIEEVRRRSTARTIPVSHAAALPLSAVVKVDHNVRGCR